MSIIYGENIGEIMFVPLFESESHNINVNRKIRIFGYMTEDDLYDKINIWIGSSYADWNHITFMAYFLKKYYETYGVRFYLASYKGNPAKTKECKDFSNLIKRFRSNDFSLKGQEEKNKENYSVNKKIYNFINWVFDKKFKTSSNTITGTRIFLSNNLINEFEAKYKRFKDKSKDDKKLKAFFEKACSIFPEIRESYELNSKKDLKVIEQSISFYNLDSDSPEVKIVRAAKKARLL